MSLSERELPPICANCESLLIACFHPPLVPLQVLLPAASLLQLMDVRKNCCDFLQSQLHPTNCLGIRAFADVHACTELLQQANAYAGEGVWGWGWPCLQLQQHILVGVFRFLGLEQEGKEPKDKKKGTQPLLGSRLLLSVMPQVAKCGLLAP